MAYVAMNGDATGSINYAKFLNGVCRHELIDVLDACLVNFLNGVCRHEQGTVFSFVFDYFLNGVCRHERPGNA